MLASKDLIAAMNRQVGNEMGASMQYIAIASHLASETLPELAKLFYAQADEERDHAMKFVHFITEVGGTVEIPQIPAPRGNFASVAQAVELSLKWEKEVTQQIYNLVEMARADSNYIAMRFLDWFVSEQLEEVSKMGGLLSLVRRAGEDNLLFIEDYIARQGAESEG